MRSVLANIINKQRGSALNPVNQLTVERRVLALSNQQTVSLDTGSVSAAHPITIIQNPSFPGNAYVACRANGGATKIYTFSLTTLADWAMSATGLNISGSGTIHALKPGFVDDGVLRFYTAEASGANVQVKRVTLTGTSNPLTGSLSNYGPTIPFSTSATSSLVKRIEAVCPVAGGDVVVALGQHNASLGFSVISFYVVNSTSAYPLAARIEIAYPAFTASNWYDPLPQAAHICAYKYNNEIVVVANEGFTDKPSLVGFTVSSNYVDSSVERILPVDPESTAVNFLPSNMTVINNILYVSGRVYRTAATKKGNPVTVNYDGYIYTTRPLNFSFGARNHITAQGAACGQLMLNSTTMYYAGKGVLCSGSATRMHIANPSSLSLTNRLEPSSTTERVSNSGEGFGAVLNNADGGLNGSAFLKKGYVLRWASGIDGEVSDMGEFGIDGINYGVAEDGTDSISVESTDLARKWMSDWGAPFFGQIMARTVVKTTLQDDDGLDVKTSNENAHKFTQSGLLVKGLNNPFIAEVADYEHGDSLQKATVRFNRSEPGANYHQSQFAFLVGNGTNGGALAVTFPKVSGWGAYALTRPEARRLTLVAIDPNDADKEGTGYNFVEGTACMTSNNQPSPAVIIPPIIGMASATSFTAAADTDYDFAVTRDGKYVTALYRVRNLTQAGAANAAHYLPLAVWEVPQNELASASKRPSMGFMANTDVAWSSDWWAQGDQDDFVTQISSAANNPIGSFGRDYAPIEHNKNWADIPNTTNVFNHAGGVVNNLTVGMHVRVYKAGHWDQVYRISAITGSTITFQATDGSAIAISRPSEFDYTFRLYVLSVADTFGNAKSGNTVETTTDGKRIDRITGAIKKIIRAAYRVFFVSDDGTAGAIRYVETSGQEHTAWSGSIFNGGTYQAWDFVNPIAIPSSWRMIARGGRIFSGTPADVALPDGLSTVRYMLVGDQSGDKESASELIRYELAAFSKQGVYPGDSANNTNWVMIPTYYSTLDGAAAGSTSLYNWRAVGLQQPGDDFGPFGTGVGTIRNAAGLLAQVVSKSAGSLPTEDDAHYVTAATYVASPGVSYVTLNKAYPNEIAEPTTVGNAPYGDVGILSGRAQKMNGAYTKLQNFDRDTVVRYAPTDGTTDNNLVDISVKRYEAYSGKYISLEDALSKVAMWAGVYNQTFRSNLASNAASQTIALTTTPQSVNVRENLSDFILDMDVHIPGHNTNNTGFAGITGLNQLRIDVRGKYRITLQAYNTAAQIAAGQQGNVRIGLQLINTTVVDAGSDGFRWVETAVARVSDYNLFGSYSGTSPNYTGSETAARNSNVKIICKESDIIVEIDGKHAWTFDISGMSAYAFYDAGVIQLSYQTAVAGNSCTVRMPELFEEAADIVVSKGQSAMAVWDSVIKGRNVKHISTANGGIQVGQFYSRTDAGSLRYNIDSDRWGEKDLSNMPHTEVVGDSSGEYLDFLDAVENGYSFASIQGDFASTGQAATLEARLSVRRAKEQAETRTITGLGFVEFEPEDKITLQYTGGGGIPTLAATDCVIESCRYNIGRESIEGTYTIRKYIGAV